MSASPPVQGGHADPSSGADTDASSVTGRWGTVSGMRSPPPAPSTGSSVRRNHTIHGARHHDKPRLEKHFEQPEGSPSGPTSKDSIAAGQSAHQSSTFNDNELLPGLQASSSFRKESNPIGSSFSATSGSAAEFVPSLTPLQALYSKSSVARNLSLPNRHSNKLSANVPQSVTQGRSNQFNSLSAITGGSDLDEHDWERLINSSNALGDEHQQDSKALHSLSTQTDPSWSSSLFAAGQLDAPATSSHPTSPITGSGPFSDGNHHDATFNDGDLFGDTQAIGSSASFLRRHQSLNHHGGRSAGHRLAARSSELRSRYAGDAADLVMSPSASQIDAAFSPVRHASSFSATNSPVMPSSYSKAPWNQPTLEPIGSPSRFAGSFPSQNHEASHKRLPSSVDDVSGSLSGLDISGSSALAADDGPDSLPRTNHSLFASATAQSSGADGQVLGGRRLPQLVTSRDALQRGLRTNGASGPMSASAFVPPIGHAHSRHQSSDPFASEGSAFDADSTQRFGPFTAAPAGCWPDKDNFTGRFGNGPAARDAGPGGQAWPQQPQAGTYPIMGMDPNVMALSMALAQEQKRNAMLQAQLGARGNTGGSQDSHFFGMQPIDLNGPMQSIGQQLRGGALPGSPPMGGMGNLPSRGQPFPMQQPLPSFRPALHAHGASPGPAVGSSGDEEAATPVDASSLALQKGYNPPPGSFGPAPPNARFFVIKSYTEDDVHKSLKYEIWASTDKGNQRLDKAFRESAHLGPIYLFYSVNASGHFCGMAQMLTPLDYATSSNVWAQDGKWKGTFKVRWIYVKDLPNNQLRHIRLTNTPECKPVTQSRDTQELTPEAGREVLRILGEWSPKTSLLQDFNFYEMQGRLPPQQTISPAPGLSLLPRNGPGPQGSPALGVAFPTSPNRAASPNGARRAQPGTPRPHGVSGLGLAPGTPRSTASGIHDLRNESGGSHDVTAAQSAGLAPSAL